MTVGEKDEELYIMADENEEVLFEETCLLTNEAIINDDLLDLIKVCQTWFLDETVKDENRKINTGNKINRKNPSKP